jgi:hypothetical protein
MRKMFVVSPLSHKDMSSQHRETDQQGVLIDLQRGRCLYMAD